MEIEKAKNQDCRDLKHISNYLSTVEDFRMENKGFSAAYYNALVRGHWSIANHLHCHLDVTFKEDDARVRKGNAPENLSTLRKPALQIFSRSL